MVLACPRAVRLLLRQIAWRRLANPPGGFLFPSRSLRKFRGVTMPNASNPTSRAQYVKALQLGLSVICGLSADSAKLWTVHSLRVWGSTYIRSLGIDDDIHRRLGGWMSLVSSRGYMQMSIDERVQANAKIVLLICFICRTPLFRIVL